MDFTGFDENFSLAGKTALVTGAGAGIGEAISLMFGRKGADLMLFDLNGDAAGRTASSAAASGRKAKGYRCDVSRMDDVRIAVDAALADFGRIDILVNCAGVGFIENAEDITRETWDKVINVNLTGAFFMAQAVGRAMITRKNGVIVNIASQAALVALDKHVAYGASKAGLVSVTKALAYEWGEYGIRANAISPTVILTEMGKGSWSGEIGERFKRQLPVGRFGYPEEVAAVAVFLASDAAGLITGANIVMDGGYTIQ